MNQSKRPFIGAIFVALIAGTGVTAERNGGPETLRSLVDAALQNDPALTAISARTRAASENVSAASTWADPRLMVGLANIGATEWTVGSEGMAQVRLELSQQIPWRGTLGASKRVAEGDVNVVAAAEAVRRNELAADVAAAAIELYHLDERVRIEEAIFALYRSMAETVTARVETGGVSQENLIVMLLEVETADARLVELRDRRLALISNLNALLNRPATTRIDSIELGELATIPDDNATLTELAKRDHPGIAQQRLSVSRDEARQKLAESQRIPDPMVGVAYGYRGSMAGIYSVSLGIPLPVHMDNRQNARARASTEVVAAGRAQVDAAETEIGGRVHVLLDRLRSTHGLRIAYSESLVPRAEQAVDATLASYSVGRTSLISVLDAGRRLHRLRLEELQLEVLERTMFVSLEQLVGTAPQIATGNAMFVQ